MLAGAMLTAVKPWQLLHAGRVFGAAAAAGAIASATGAAAIRPRKSQIKNAKMTGCSIFVAE
jgi:hypothetical protein